MYESPAQLAAGANTAASHTKAGLPSVRTSDQDQQEPLLHWVCPSPISVTGALVMYETREHAKELKNEDTPPSSC